MLPGVRRPFPLAGTPQFDPDLARNGLIWCRALDCGNNMAELVFRQVLHLPSGKLSVSQASAIPELAEGPPALPHVADSPPPLLNLPAEPLSAVPHSKWHSSSAQEPKFVVVSGALGIAPRHT